MRLHKSGFLQAKKVEAWLPDDLVRRAQSVGATIGEGLEREVEGKLGISIEGASRARMMAGREGERLVLIESDWRAPTDG